MSQPFIFGHCRLDLLLCFFDLCPRWRNQCVANDLSTEKAPDAGPQSLFIDFGSVSCGLCVSHTATHLPAFLAPNPEIFFFSLLTALLSFNPCVFNWSLNLILI